MLRMHGYYNRDRCVFSRTHYSDDFTNASFQYSHAEQECVTKISVVHHVNNTSQYTPPAFYQLRMHYTFGFIQPYVRGLLNYTDYYTDMHASLTMFNSKAQQVCIFKLHIQIYAVEYNILCACSVMSTCSSRSINEDATQ